MTIVDKAAATASLGEYAASIAGEAVIVASEGKPVAALVPIENADLETVGLSTDRQFIDLIERSRARVTSEGGISSQEMRRRFA